MSGGGGGGGECAPRFLKTCQLGVPVHQQHRELMGGERMEWCARGAWWPPCQMPFREAFETQPEALPIVDQQLDGGATAVAEEKDGARERVSVELGAAACGKRINALAEIDGIVGKHDGELWRQLDHGLGTQKGGAEGLELSWISGRQMECQA